MIADRCKNVTMAVADPRINPFFQVLFSVFG